jgi:hypothetical protein
MKTGLKGIIREAFVWTIDPTTVVELAEKLG